MKVSDEMLKKALLKQSKEIATLKEEHKILRMHYTGIGMTDYLTRINTLENEAQITLRKKYARSNKDLFANLSSPINKVFYHTFILNKSSKT